MHPYQLEVFCKVVACGGFSQAALELYITQPAVSQQIKALEKSLTVRLLNRGAGQLTLTEAGEIVFRHAVQILSAQAEMRRLLDALNDGTRGRVSLGASSTGVLYYLPPLLRRFRAVNPDIEVLLTSDITDRLRSAVIEGERDVGLVWGPVADPRLAAVPFYQAPFVIVCSPDHPLAQQPLVSPRDLSGHPFVMNLRGTTTRQYIETALRQVGVSPAVAVEGTSTENIKKVVESGLGIALVARRAVEQEVTLGTLRIIPVQGLTVMREITLVVKTARQLPPAVDRFVAYVLGAQQVFADQEKPLA